LCLKHSRLKAGCSGTLSGRLVQKGKLIGLSWDPRGWHPLQRHNFPSLDLSSCSFDSGRCEKIQSANIVFFTPNPGSFRWCSWSGGQVLSGGKDGTIRIPWYRSRSFIHRQCVFDLRQTIGRTGHDQDGFFPQRSCKETGIVGYVEMQMSRDLANV
jgi:hypothetical protein